MIPVHSRVKRTMRDKDSNGMPDSGERDPKRRAWMRSRRGRTGETFWYTIAGYLFIVGLTVVTIAVGTVAYQLPLDSGLLVLGLVAFSVVPYPAFLLDAVYLRSIGSVWLPNLKLYLGIGIIAPVCFGVAASYVLLPIEAIGIGLFSLLPVTVALSVLHLVQRHRYVRTQ